MNGKWRNNEMRNSIIDLKKTDRCQHPTVRERKIEIFLKKKKNNKKETKKKLYLIPNAT